MLGSDEIDSQRSSFYLVEGDREDIIRKIPIVLQIEEDPKTYKEAMTSRDVFGKRLSMMKWIKLCPTKHGNW